MNKESSTHLEILVYWKKEVLDPEARTILEVSRKNFSHHIKDLKIQRRFEVVIDEPKDKALPIAESIAKDFLANSVAQDYHIQVISN